MTIDHLDDEALSALLDGEATPGEAEHVEGCDACAARLDELRAAAEAIGTPPPAPSEAAREAAIAAALAAAPASLAERRSRRTPPTWLLAAAAVLVLAALVPLLGRALDTGGDDEETAAQVADESSTMSAEEDAAASAGSSAAPTAAGLDLGAVDGRELADVVGPTLARTLRQGADEGGPEALESATDADAPCEADLRATDPGLGTLRLVGDVTAAGRPARILAFERPPGSIVAVVVAVDDCAVLRSETFDSP